MDLTKQWIDDDESSPIHFYHLFGKRKESKPREESEVNMRILEVHDYSRITKETTVYKIECESLADAILWIQCLIESNIELEMYKPRKFKTYII